MAKSNIPAAVQKLVRERARGYCEYCLVPSGFSSGTFPIDHILPKSQKGGSGLENLALACGGCNSYKHDKTHAYDPLSLQLTALYHPRTDDWHHHFQWNKDGTLVIGITPKGRATVDLLQMNKEGNVNLRKLLVSAGAHPPKDFP